MPQWVQAPGSFNTSLSGAEIAYDHLHDRTIAFGGQFGYLPTSITSLLDGDTWSNATPAEAPPGRVSHTMAFDTSRGEVLV